MLNPIVWWAFARAFTWSICHLFVPHRITSLERDGRILWIAATGEKITDIGGVNGFKIIKVFLQRK